MRLFKPPSISLLITGTLLIIIAQVTGVGYFLFEWAHNLPVGMAAWVGFMLWLKLVLTGALFLIVGMWLLD